MIEPDIQMRYLVETRVRNWQPSFNTEEWMQCWKDGNDPANFVTFDAAIKFMKMAEENVPWANYRITRK